MSDAATLEALVVWWGPSASSSFASVASVVSPRLSALSPPAGSAVLEGRLDCDPILLREDPTLVEILGGIPGSVVVIVLLYRKTAINNRRSIPKIPPNNVDSTYNEGVSSLDTYLSDGAVLGEDSLELADSDVAGESTHVNLGVLWRGLWHFVLVLLNYSLIKLQSLYLR